MRKRERVGNVQLRRGKASKKVKKQESEKASGTARKRVRSGESYKARK